MRPANEAVFPWRAIYFGPLFYSGFSFWAALGNAVASVGLPSRSRRFSSSIYSVRRSDKCESDEATSQPTHIGTIPVNGAPNADQPGEAT